MGWSIKSSINDGYPNNGIIYKEIKLTKPYPTSVWWIGPDKDPKNDGYPWHYQWFDYNNVPGDNNNNNNGDNGDKKVSKFGNGGTTTKYQYGTKALGATDIFGDYKLDTDDSSRDTIATETYVGQVVSNCTNCYVASSATVINLIRDITTFAADHPVQTTIVQQIYGANIYNSVILCRQYPFSLTSGETKTVHLCGVDLSFSAPACNSFYKSLDFGEITLNVSTTAQITQCEYSIYLPFAGLYSIHVSDNSTLHLQAVADLLTGELTYLLSDNSQPILTASGKCGIDIPLNLSQGAMLQNAINSSVQIATTIGAGIASGGASVLGSSVLASASSVLNGVSNISNNNHTSVDTSCKITGGLCGYGLPLDAYVLTRECDYINDLTNYPNTNGLPTIKWYDNLQDIPERGFVKCVNYLCPSTGATSTEKQAMEQLLNNGVIL